MNTDRGRFPWVHWTGENKTKTRNEAARLVSTFSHKREERKWESEPEQRKRGKMRGKMREKTRGKKNLPLPNPPNFLPDPGR